jgi:PhnB protein
MSRISKSAASVPREHGFMTTQSTTGATGAHTTDGRPHTATSLTPFLAIRGAKEALDFYRDVFGARVTDVTEFDSLVVHAGLDFGLGILQIGEPSPAYGLVPAPEGDEDCYSIGLYVPDVDDVTARAVAAGATVREEPSTFVSGDRFASIRDPFGVRWSIMTRVEDLSEDESAARVAEWAASVSAG